MNYVLEIDKKNVLAHVDIENDIQKQQNGLFTFILKINNGVIADYNVVEYIDARQYLRLKKIIIQELTFAHNPVIGDKKDAIRADNS